MIHAYIYLHCTCCSTRLTVSISTFSCSDKKSTAFSAAAVATTALIVLHRVFISLPASQIDHMAPYAQSRDPVYGTYIEKVVSSITCHHITTL